MGSALTSLLASRSRGGRIVFIGGDFCRWFSAHTLAKYRSMAKTTLGVVVCAGICSVCGAVVDGFGFFSSDAWRAFYITSVLVFMDCFGVFDALCAFGAD